MDETKPDALVPPTPPSPEAVLRQDSIILLRPLRGLHWAMCGVLGVPAVVYVLGAIIIMLSISTAEMKDIEVAVGVIFLLYLFGALIHWRIIAQLSRRPYHRWGFILGLPWIIILASLIGAGWIRHIFDATYGGGVFEAIAELQTLIIVLLPMPFYFILAALSTIIVCQRDIKALFSAYAPTDH
ncbi:MAG: hypothetical protein BWY76_01130 [bacterium ADurb.Bin429]|nr:MAG: hypothetical protein BWY76_01130 [bacterium ADurb.Bin429]